METGQISEHIVLETLYAVFQEMDTSLGLVLVKKYRPNFTDLLEKELANSNMLPISDRFFIPIGKDKQNRLLYPYLKLQTLNKWIDEQNINESYTRDAFEIAKQILQLTGILHKGKWLHGSINPHHILIDKDLKVYLSEWTFITDARKPRLVEKERYQSKEIIHYIAPEQTGRYNIKPSYYTDLYSIGVTLFKLFTGQVPFEGGDTLSVIYKHLTVEPLPANEYNQFMGRAVAALIAEMLIKDPQKRIVGTEAALFALDQSLTYFLNGELSEELIFIQNIHLQNFLITRHFPAIVENKIERFLNLFQDAVEREECFLFFVEGIKGTGKQYIVNHLSEKVSNKQTLVIDSFFLQHDPVPYEAFKIILDQITRYYLSQPEDELNSFVNTCINNLGSAANILIDVCPDLKQIIPYYKQYKEEGPIELQNQLIYAFASFLKSFLRMDKKLVICLKDIHHATIGALKIIQGILNEFPGTQMNFIFTYENHQLSSEQSAYIHQWQNLEQQGFVKAKIDLLPLTNSQTVQLLSMAGLNENDIEAAAAILLPKTSGLVNLVEKACEKLVDNGGFVFDFEKNSWTLDLEIAYATNINFNNPVSYYEVLIARLTNEELILLTYAAAFGNTFWFDLVKAAIKNERLAINLLEQLLHKGILMPSSRQGFYAFSEMELASFLLRNTPESSLQEIYLSIIGAYISLPELPEFEEDFFILLDKLLNIPASACKPYKQLLRKGIEKSIKIALFEVNFRCYKHLIDMSELEDWEINPIGQFDLHLEYIKAASLVLKFDICEQTYQFLKTKAKNLLQLGRLGFYYANALFIQQDFRKSILVIAEILATMEVTISANPSLFKIILSMISLQQTMRGKDLDYIEKLPTVTDKLAQIKILLLQNAMGAAYLYAPKMIPELTSKQLSLSLKSGASDSFGLCLTCYSFILSMYSNKPQEAIKLYDVSVRMNERFKDSVAIATSEFLYATFIAINHISWKSCSERLYDNYIFSRQIGQINIAFFSLITHFSNRFYAESNLEKMAEAIREILPIVKSNKQQNALSYLEILLAFTSDFIGEKIPDRPMIKYLPEIEQIKEIAFKDSEFTTLNHIYILEEMFQFFTGQYEVSKKRVDKMLEMKQQLGMVNSFTMHHFFLSLKLLKKPSPLKFWEKRFVRKTINLISKAAKLQVENTLSKSWLLKGLWELKKKDNANAMLFLQRAMDTAILYEQYMVAGIATYELAIIFQQLGMPELEKACIHQSHTQYNFWGAKILVRQLESAYPFLQRGKEPFAIKQLNSGLETDFQSFIKASNSISSEINLDKLLANLINVLIENAAAENAFFIIPDNINQFVIQASKKGTEKVETSQVVANKRNLPISIIQYVYRTRETLILNNASNETAFKNDPYIQSNQVRSLLCLPVLKNNVVQGLILLENNLINQAFTLERTEIVKLLASQIAVSFENATLYNNVEQKIILRTSELQKEKEKSEELLLNIIPAEIAEELKQKGSSAAKQYGHVTVLFSDFVNFTILSETYSPTELVAELDYCFRAFDSITTEFGLEKIKTIGDAYLAVCGLPIEEEKHAEKVLEAALAIQKFVLENKRIKKASSNIYFDIRIGIHSGPVVAGIVGNKKFAYDIWGDTVNTAARMVENCDVNRINISGTTYELIKDYFECEYRGKIDAKNKGLVDMYFVNDFFLLEKIKHRVYNRLKDLDQRLHYHTIWHTTDVLVQVERIAKSEGVTNERDLLLLKIAALYHDTGFLETYNNHEEAGCRIFMEDAEIMLYELTINEKEIICQIIMATKIPQEPNGLFEEIICDADLDYLGREDFWLIGKKLFAELHTYGFVKDETEWNILQHSFLEKHQYFTKTTKKERTIKKAEYLHAINLKLMQNKK
jgi:histidine kinase